MSFWLCSWATLTKTDIDVCTPIKSNITFAFRSTCVLIHHKNGSHKKSIEKSYVVMKCWQNGRKARVNYSERKKDKFSVVVICKRSIFYRNRTITEIDFGCRHYLLRRLNWFDVKWAMNAMTRWLFLMKWKFVPTMLDKNGVESTMLCFLTSIIFVSFCCFLTLHHTDWSDRWDATNSNYRCRCRWLHLWFWLLVLFISFTFIWLTKNKQTSIANCCYSHLSTFNVYMHSQ